MEFDQQTNIVYGYKDGMGLIMDVYTPQSQRCGSGIVLVAAGGWQSDIVAYREAFKECQDNPDKPGRFVLLESLLSAGYVVFVTAHSSAPRYTVDDIRSDIPRAVRFIRHHAARFGMDAQRIGILGGSSGGQISLMAAIAPPCPDVEAEDPVDRESSEVQAVATYFPVTDLLNADGVGTNIEEDMNAYCLKEGLPPNNAPWDFKYWNEKEQRFERVTDPVGRTEYFQRNSPIENLNTKTPPVLILYGTQEHPHLQRQVERLGARMQELGLEHKVVVFSGDHAIPTPPENDQQEVLAWFELYLLKH